LNEVKKKYTLTITNLILIVTLMYIYNHHTDKREINRVGVLVFF